MNKNEFWIRLCLAGSAFLLIANLVHAQSAPAPLTFEALPRAHREDSVRVAAPAKRDPAVGLKNQLTTQRDSIERLNRALVVATRVPQTPTAPPTPAPRVDTVRLRDTVRIAPVKADKPAIPSFNPTSVAGLLQIQMSGGDSALRSSYRVRRAEVKLVTDLGRGALAVVMVDLSKALSLTTAGATPSVTQSSRILQDAFVSLPIHRLQVDAGQQRLPLGLEGSMSASALETVDRALMESDKARGASFGDVRDLGVGVRGKWRWLDYRAGVFNGSGEVMNDVDKNVGKALVGQIALRPSFLRGLRVGSSAATSGQGTGDKPTRDRVGTDLQYVRGRLLVQTEAMRGQDGAVTRTGLYALGAFSIVPSLRLVARFDGWDPNISSELNPADVTERDYLAGLTWLPRATRMKVQAAVVRKTYSHAITPSATLAITQFQASW